MKVIDFNSIKSLNISPDDSYDWVSEMIIQKDRSLLPPKTHLNLPGNVFCNVMPCIIFNMGESNMGGVKIVTRYPEREPSLDSKILLFNADNGEILALMDGNWITAMRTGAVAAHSIIHFAKDNWSTVGMIGLGNVARSSLLVLQSQINKPINIKLLRYKDQAERIIERFSQYNNLNFSVVDTVEECVKGSDVIVSCATYLDNDIARDDWFDEGVLVVPVHTRGFMNCDLFFDKIYADDTSHVDHFKYFSRFRYYAEVSDVMNNNAIGRENNQERILVYNIGVSIHDINYAAHIYQFYMQNQALFNSLPDAEMHDPKEKFWV